MRAILRFFAVAALLVSGVRAADDVVSAVHGVVTKTDAGTKTIVVKTADGTEQTFHWVGSTTVREPMLRLMLPRTPSRVSRKVLKLSCTTPLRARKRPAWKLTKSAKMA